MWLSQGLEAVVARQQGKPLPGPDRLDWRFFDFQTRYELLPHNLAAVDGACQLCARLDAAKLLSHSFDQTQEEDAVACRRLLRAALVSRAARRTPRAPIE